MELTREQNRKQFTAKAGDKVYWQYPNDEVPSGWYVVSNDYPPKGGSASYVELVDVGSDYPFLALPEELSYAPPATAHEATPQPQ